MSNQEFVGRIKIELSGDKQVAQSLSAVSKEQQRLLDQVAKLDKANDSFRKMQSSIKAFGGDAKVTAELIDGLNGSIAEIGRAKSITQLAQQFASMSKNQKQADADLKTYIKTLKALGATQDEIERGTGDFKTFSSANLGPSPTANPKLSASSAVSSISGIGRGVGSLVNGDVVGGIQSIATASAQAAPALTAAGVGIGTMAAAAAIALPALIAVALAIKQFAGIIQAGQEGIDNGIAQVTIYNQSLLLTSNQIKEQIKAKEDDAKVNEEIIKTLNANIDLARRSGLPDISNPAVAKRDSIQSTVNKTYSEINGLNDALGTTAVAANDATEALKKAQSEQIRDANTQAAREVRDAQLIRGAREGSADALKETIAGIGDQIKAASNDLFGLEQIADPTEDTTKRIEELKEQIRDLSRDSYHLGQDILPVVTARDKEAVALRKQKEALDAAARAADEFANNTRKLADLNKSRNTTLEDRARDDSRNSQISSIEQKIAAAKEIEAEQSRLAKVTAIRDKARDQEGDALRKLGDERAKINAEFMQNELSELAAYRKTEARETDKYATERRRKLEDLNASLSELASKGDVAGFVRAQREGNVDLRRGAEDFGTEARQRAEDFTDGVRQRQAEREQKLQDLKDSFNAERAQRQQNLQQQLAQEAEAGKARILQSQVLEQELAALKEQFAAEDLVRQRKQEDEAFNAQVQALKDRQKELAGIIAKGTDPVITAAGSLVRKVGDELNRAIANLRAGAAMARSSSQPRIGGPQALVNDEGGVYTKPTLTIMSLAPTIGDIVIPFRKSEGVGPAMERMMQQYGGMGGGSPVININNPQFGAIATPADLAAVKQEITSGVVEGVRLARQGGAA